MMFYSTKIFEDVFLNKDNSAIYVHGTKLCSNMEDYTLIKDYVMLLNKNLQNNKNIEQKVSLDFSVEIQRRIKQSDLSANGLVSREVDVIDNNFVNLELSIKQKESVKSLCIKIDNIVDYASKINLDTFLFQLQKFDGERKGKHSFVCEFGMNGPDDEFLISIGEIILSEDVRGVDYE